MSKQMMYGAVIALTSLVAGAAWGKGGEDAQPLPLPKAKEQVLRLNELGTEKQPHVLDLARESDLKISTHTSGAAYVRILNMLPSRLPSYVLEYESTRISMPAWTDPRKTSPATLAGTSCGALHGAIDDVLKATEEAALPVLLETMADASRAAEQEMAKAAAEAKKSGGTPAGGCADYVDAADELAVSTRKLVVLDIRRGSEATLRMRRGELKREIVLRSEPRQWLTHVGFTFMDNKDERYYSREIAAAPGTYEVARQSGNQRYKYAATALFTYPMSNHASGVDVGFTAGVGASAENVAVIAGVGILFGENVLLTVGAAVQEFDVLSGVYQEGQVLGAQPVDSSALADKTYKTSVMATLGFRFGSK